MLNGNTCRLDCAGYNPTHLGHRIPSRYEAQLEHVH